MTIGEDCVFPKHVPANSVNVDAKHDVRERNFHIRVNRLRNRD